MKIQADYFYRLDNSKIVKVIWKKHDKADILEIGETYPTAIVDVDRLTGIELTSVILHNKFGFEFYDLGNFYKIKLDDFVLITPINDNKDAFNDFIFVLKSSIEGSVKIKYVHELQNLYYALKNKELQWKS